MPGAGANEQAAASGLDAARQPYKGVMVPIYNKNIHWM